VIAIENPAAVRLQQAVGEWDVRHGDLGHRVGDHAGTSGNADKAIDHDGLSGGADVGRSCLTASGPTIETVFGTGDGKLLNMTQFQNAPIAPAQDDGL